MAKRIVFTDIKTYEVIIPDTDIEATDIVAAYEEGSFTEERDGALIYEVVNAWLPYAEAWEYIDSFEDRVFIRNVEDVEEGTKPEGQVA